MRFLLFSCTLILGACAADYKALKPADFNQACLDKIKPALPDRQLYDASIDVVNRHISGLLIVKTLEDGSRRVVFTNEAGIKYLDFGWTADRDFHRYFIMEQLDKKAVVELLRRDFELLIGIYYRNSQWKGWRNGSEYLMTTPVGNDRFYVVTDEDCTGFVRAELGSKRKRVVSISYPDHERVQIQHHTFDMQITLKKIDRE